MKLNDARRAEFFRGPSLPGWCLHVLDGMGWEPEGFAELCDLVNGPKGSWPSSHYVFKPKQIMMPDPLKLMPGPKFYLPPIV